MPRSSETAPFFNPAHARWVVGVLNMLIAVVGKDTLLGVILGQTRAEIASLVRNPAAACYENN